MAEKVLKHLFFCLKNFIKKNSYKKFKTKNKFRTLGESGNFGILIFIPEKMVRGSIDTNEQQIGQK